MAGRVTSSMTQVIALAVWLGAATFFAAAVAPALFAVLPSRTLAGAVVGRLLPVILYAGMLIGILVTVSDGMAGGWRWRGRGGLGALIVAACAVAQFVIGARIARVRAQIPGAIDDLPVDDARRVAFGRLHGLSVGWLGLAMIAGLVALVLAVRSLQSRS
ncbi:MAG TPA: DUF4149 domain-containing protein [Gemmatimonadaceae bacterium]|nr:DUF4149 domain-containing protein [Gemmatimonadaceae bacterium]